jgi:hypothetical protein
MDLKSVGRITCSPQHLQFFVIHNRQESQTHKSWFCIVSILKFVKDGPLQQEWKPYSTRFSFRLRSPPYITFAKGSRDFRQPSSNNLSKIVVQNGLVPGNFPSR